MHSKLFNYFKKISSPKILSLQSKIDNYSKLIAITYIFAILTAVARYSGEVYQYYILMVVGIVLIFFRVYVQILLLNVTTSILSDELSPKKYLAVQLPLEKYYRNKKRASKSAIYYLPIATAYLMQGETDKAKDTLNILDSKRIKNREFLGQYYYLQGIVNLRLNRLEQAFFFRDKLRALVGKAPEKIAERQRKKLDLLESLISIHKGESVDDDFTETDFLKSRLWKLFYQYYRAKNYLLKDEKEEALKIFKVLSTENDELFFVREAKQYLENLAES